MSSTFHFDFRLNEVGLELSSLRDYHDLLASEFNTLEEKAVEQVEKEWNLSDLGENQIAQQMIEFAKIELPRLLWGSFVMMARSVFESGVIEVADLLRTAHGIPLRISDLKGTFETQTKRYYQDVLNFSLTDFDGQAWEQIVHVGRVRNILAHSSGRLDMMTPQRRSAIEKTISQDIGVSVETLFGNYLVISQDFAAASLDAIETVLKDAVKRAIEESDRLKKAKSATQSEKV